MYMSFRVDFSLNALLLACSAALSRRSCWLQLSQTEACVNLQVPTNAGWVLE